MSRTYLARHIVLVSGLFLLLSFTFKNSPETTGEFCRNMVLENLAGIQTELRLSLQLIEGNKTDQASVEQLKAHYRVARKHYKQIEFFIEYYSPFEAKFFINGPLVPKLEIELGSTPFEPQGFQVIEETLFDPEKTNPEVLKKEYRLLSDKFTFLSEHYTTIQIEDNKLDEALKLQLVRIMCLTLNGYDCTISKETLTETINSLQGLQNVLANYSGNIQNKGQRKDLLHILSLFEKAKKVLRKHPDSDTFDRLDFMVSKINPIYSAMINFSKSAKMGHSDIHYAVNLHVPSFFEAASIDKQHFSIYVSDTTGIDSQAELGKILFYDPILSGNNMRACASCHKADKGFADGLDKSTGFDRVSKVTRNAPTLINASYQKLFFHDGRLFNLEGQAGAVFNNTFEMNTSENEIINKLRSSDEYRQLFREAFKNKPDTAVTFYGVLKSIAEYIKTLDSRNSRFDKYLRGKRKQLTSEEKKGYNLFAGKALCGSCHFFPLFNGTVPPMFNDNEFEVIGVPEKTNHKDIDPDTGREKTTGSEIHKHAFKTPTVRNIDLTGPYMHNGVYATIDSVLTFYNRGGGAGSGIKVKNQTLPFDSLGLSNKELQSIKAFLLTLTDLPAHGGPPESLPRFKNETLNQRKIGGEY